MICKNCGAQMVSGQIICSNCDYDNSSSNDIYSDNTYNYDSVSNTDNILVNTDIYADNNKYASNTDLQSYSSSNIDNEYINKSDVDTDNKKEEKENKKEKEKSSKKRVDKEDSLEQTDINKKRIVKVLSIIIIILIIIPILYIVISSNMVNGAIDKIKKETYVSQYEKIRDQVNTKINSGEEVICSRECKEKYDYTGIALTITENEGYYTINISASADDKYSDVKLEKDDCSSYENTVCNGDIIIGRVYK